MVYRRACRSLEFFRKLPKDRPPNNKQGPAQSIDHPTQQQPCAVRRDYDKMEHCPSCYNAQGPDEIKNRAIAETDPTALAEYGGGDQWPLIISFKNGENAPNGEKSFFVVAAQWVHLNARKLLRKTAVPWRHTREIRRWQRSESVAQLMYGRLEYCKRLVCSENSTSNFAASSSRVSLLVAECRKLPRATGDLREAWCLRRPWTGERFVIS